MRVFVGKCSEWARRGRPALCQPGMCKHYHQHPARPTKKHIWGAADICASSLRLCGCVGVIQDGSFLRLPVPPAAG